MLIFSLVMCFTINPLLSVIFVVVVPIVGIALLCIVYKAHPVFERVFKTYDTLNNNVQENLTGIRVVKAYVREEHEKEKFGKVSQNIYANFPRRKKSSRSTARLCNLPSIYPYYCCLGSVRN